MMDIAQIQKLNEQIGELEAKVKHLSEENSMHLRMRTTVKEELNKVMEENVKWEARFGVERIKRFEAEATLRKIKESGVPCAFCNATGKVLNSDVEEGVVTNFERECTHCSGNGMI